MNRLILSDLKKRNKFRSLEIKQRSLKYITSNEKMDTNVRLKALLELTKVSRNKTRTQCHNRCVLTGRSRAIFKDMRISRLQFRSLARSNRLPGVSDFSW